WLPAKLPCYASGRFLRFTLGLLGQAPSPATLKVPPTRSMDHGSTLTLVTCFFDRLGTVSCVSPQITIPSKVLNPAMMVTAFLSDEKGTDAFHTRLKYADADNDNRPDFQPS